MAKPRQTKQQKDHAALVEHLKKKYPDFLPKQSASPKEKHSYALKFILGSPTRDDEMSALYAKHILNGGR